MRDAFEDGLERMARLEELAQRRAKAQQNAGPMAMVRSSAVDEVTEAVRRVLASYPGTTVALTVDGPGGPVAFQVGWKDGELVVTPGPTPDAAARLADLIRRDPGWLAAETDPRSTGSG
jgi:hypothetical protein